MEMNFPVFTDELRIPWSTEVASNILKKEDRSGCQTEWDVKLLSGPDKLRTVVSNFTSQDFCQ